MRFTIVASLGAEVIYELWFALSNVLVKLLTAISLWLAVNHSDISTKFKKNISLSIFLAATAYDLQV